MLYFLAFRVGVESQWVTPEESLSGGLAVCMGTDVGNRRAVPGVQHLPAGPPHPHSDFIVSQMCGKHREWGGSCASQVCAKPTLSRVPLARGLIAPLPAAPPPLSLRCSVPAEASGIRLGSEPASSWRGPPALAPCQALGLQRGFPREAPDSPCCQRAEGLSHLGGLLAVGPALLTAPSALSNSSFLPCTGLRATQLQ